MSKDKNTQSADEIREELQKAVSEQTETADKLEKAQETIQELTDKLEKSVAAQQESEKRIQELESRFNDDSDPDTDDIFKSLDLEDAINSAGEDGGVVEVQKFLDTMVNDNRAGLSLINKAVQEIAGDHPLLLKSVKVLLDKVQELEKSVDVLLATPMGGPKAMQMSLQKSFEDKSVPVPTPEQLFKARQQRIITPQQQAMIKVGQIDNISADILKQVASL